MNTTNCLSVCLSQQIVEGSRLTFDKCSSKTTIDILSMWNQVYVFSFLISPIFCCTLYCSHVNKKDFPREIV